MKRYELTDTAVQITMGDQELGHPVFVYEAETPADARKLYAEQLPPGEKGRAVSAEVVERPVPPATAEVAIEETP